MLRFQRAHAAWYCDDHAAATARACAAAAPGVAQLCGARRRHGRLLFAFVYDITCVGQGAKGLQEVWCEVCGWGVGPKPLPLGV